MAESKPSVAVVSGRYPVSDFESASNHKVYCDRHGYAYFNCAWPTTHENRYLNKMEYVRAHYGLFDYVFWIDDDAFFLDLDQSLEPYLPKGDAFISFCASPSHKSIHTYISSGQFGLRCDDTGRAFIDEVARVDLRQVQRWWTDDLGYFTRGDQDSMVYLLKTDPRFALYDRHEHTAFNQRAEEVLDGDDVFIVHFTGPVPVKLKNYKRVQRHLGRGPSLLPFEEARRWQLEEVTRRLRHRVERKVIRWLEQH